MPTNFQATVQGYHPHNAHLLALLSACAYSTPAAMVPPPGVTLVDFIDEADTTAVVCTSPDAAFVAFRGSVGRYDWLNTDANTNLEPLSSFPLDLRRVHIGFLNALDAAQTQLDTLLALPSVAGKPLWLTGHSLGGALAVLLAARMTLLEGRPVQGLYTFGQPRVGNRTFARVLGEALSDRYFCILRAHDPIPHCPSLLRYRPCGTQLLLAQDGKLYGELSFGERLKDGIATAREFLKNPGLDIAKLHQLTAYIQALATYPVPA